MQYLLHVEISSDMYQVANYVFTRRFYFRATFLFEQLVLYFDNYTANALKDIHIKKKKEEICAHISVKNCKFFIASKHEKTILHLCIF